MSRSLLIATGLLAAIAPALAMAQAPGAIIGSRSETICDDRGNCRNQTSYERAPPEPQEAPKKGPGSQQDVYYLIRPAPNVATPAVAPPNPDPNFCGPGFRYTAASGCVAVKR